MQTLDSADLRSRSEVALNSDPYTDAVKSTNLPKLNRQMMSTSITGDLNSKLNNTKYYNQNKKSINSQSVKRATTMTSVGKQLHQ